MYHVTMQITFHIPAFACKERNLHCDVVHITTVWVSRLFGSCDRSDPDVAIKAYDRLFGLIRYKSDDFSEHLFSYTSSLNS